MATTDTRVSRRVLLKRAGAGAAALGAGSLVTASTAGADASPSLACTHNGCKVCSGLLSCKGSECCSCFVTVEGCCFCAEAIFCDDLLTCASSKQCPPGWACIRSCCDEIFGYHTICAPPCGTFIPGWTPCGGPGAPTGASRPTSRG